MHSRIPAACASSAITRAFALNCSTSSGVSASPVNVLSTRTSSALAGGEDVPEAPQPLVEVERRVPAQRHAAQPEPVEQPPCLVDLRRPEPVGVEVLEKSLDGTDLDVLEPRLGQPVQRLARACTA